MIIEEYIEEIEKLTKRLKTATTFEELSVCSERLGILNKNYLEKELDGVGNEKT